MKSHQYIFSLLLENDNYLQVWENKPVLVKILDIFLNKAK